MSVNRQRRVRSTDGFEEIWTVQHPVFDGKHSVGLALNGPADSWSTYQKGVSVITDAQKVNLEADPENRIVELEFVPLVVNGTVQPVNGRYELTAGFANENQFDVAARGPEKETLLSYQIRLKNHKELAQRLFYNKSFLNSIIVSFKAVAQ